VPHSLIYRHLEVAAVLREAGGRGGVRDHKAALITAAAAGDENEVRALLDDGANANCADYDKRTVTQFMRRSRDDEGTTWGKYHIYETALSCRVRTHAFACVYVDLTSVHQSAPHPPFLPP
jgi:Neuraminidase (sialidase)